MAIIDFRLFTILIVGSVVQNGVVAFRCPSPNGFFADDVQCDKYVECLDDLPKMKLCPDGLVFNSRSPLYVRCDLPHMADCKGREQRQPPRPTEHCPRRNGLFAHNCSHFWSCKDVEKSVLHHCPDGLVFLEAKGQCEWPDVAQLPDCDNATEEQESIFGVDNPPPTPAPEDDDESGVLKDIANRTLGKNFAIVN